MQLLGESPLVDSTVVVRASRLGRFTELGASTSFIESALGDYSYVVNDSSVIYRDFCNFCSIAAHTRINPRNHPRHRASQSQFTHRASDNFEGESDDADFFNWLRASQVRIGHDVWIGHGASVLPGRSIGNGALAAAGSVVTEDVAGNSARLVRRRFADRISTRLEALAWWDWEHNRQHRALADLRTLSVEAFLDKHER